MPADGWAICVQLSVFQASEIKGRRLVRQPSTFGSQREVPRERVFCTHAIKACPCPQLRWHAMEKSCGFGVTQRWCVDPTGGGLGSFSVLVSTLRS
jgi:hypothetical protein